MTIRIVDNTSIRRKENTVPRSAARPALRACNKFAKRGKPKSRQTTAFRKGDQTVSTSLEASSIRGGQKNGGCTPLPRLKHDPCVARLWLRTILLRSHATRYNTQSQFFGDEAALMRRGACMTQCGSGCVRSGQCVSLHVLLAKRGRTRRLGICCRAHSAKPQYRGFFALPLRWWSLLRSAGGGRSLECALHS